MNTALLSPERPAAGDGPRLLALARILRVAELVAPLRHGATLRDINQDINDQLGVQYCERTIRRDCELLESLGVVSFSRGRVHWLAGSVRAVVIERVAAAAAERFD